ncbi:MAG: ABC transporter ATP-binding protein [Chitinophagaceae bacterium]|nr:ABC transporter ATP-binding protein [Chitinophagaceae bacterium]
MNGSQQDITVSLRKVSYRYGENAVLRDLDFEVKKGELVVLVGPSGCGKTTILNLISGYIQPGSGEVFKSGIIRTVYQQDGLFPWLTVGENIEMGLRSEKAEGRREEKYELLDLIHLSGFENHYPHQLSGGMRQRVELARALAGQSDILLMDEPFSALDYQTRLHMRQELVVLMKQRPRTVVFVTHDIEEAAQLADRIFVLSKRPATILKELAINAERPRELTGTAVVEAMKAILTELGFSQ